MARSARSSRRAAQSTATMAAQSLGYCDSPAP